jgi:hypothetical protein
MIKAFVLNVMMVILSNQADALLDHKLTQLANRTQTEYAPNASMVSISAQQQNYAEK